MVPRAIFESVKYGTPETFASCRQVPFRRCNSKTMSLISIIEPYSVPRVAQSQVPPLAQWSSYAPFMAKKIRTIQQLLADNVGKLMVREGAKKYSLRDVSDAPDVKLGANTVKRMQEGERDPKLGSLAEVAKFFGVEPWQLLHPDFDPDKGIPTRVLNKKEAEYYERLLANFRGLMGGEESPQ